jgi:hypothetical protein
MSVVPDWKRRCSDVKYIARDSSSTDSSDPSIGYLSNCFLRESRGRGRGEHCGGLFWRLSQRWKTNRWVLRLIDEMPSWEMRCVRGRRGIVMGWAWDERRAEDMGCMRRRPEAAT